MEGERMKQKLAALVIIVALLAVSAAAASAQSVQVKTSPGGASYLADDNGMTLYYYTLDANGQSACYGGCAKAWPVYYAANLAAGDGLSADDFGTITRTDGTRQTTYKGWPLYYWFKDKAAGDMTGEGVQKAWYVLQVPAYTVMIGTNKAVGNYLVDGSGNALYWFSKDKANMSACSGDCLKAWPAFISDSVVVPSGLKASDFGTLTRDDGTAQVTYKGFPLYYWFKDKTRGDITGQNVGKVWFVIDPEKFPPKM
jgi:predicted lipoprotein with Yx(FWY)xxD motif